MYRILSPLAEGMVLIICMFAKMIIYVPFFMVVSTLIIIISSIESIFKRTRLASMADMRLDRTLKAVGIELRFR